jgi:hypothetical protein
MLFKLEPGILAIIELIIKHTEIELNENSLASLSVFVINLYN